MKKIFFAIMFLAFSFSMSLAQTEVELIGNNDFEDGLDGWSFMVDSASSAVNASFELDTNSVISGKNSVKCTIDSSEGGSPSAKIALYVTNLNIEEGKDYNVSLKIRSTKAFPEEWDIPFASLYRSPLAPEYASIGYASILVAKEDSTIQFEGTVTAEKTDSNAIFAIDFGYFPVDSTVTIWIDDVSVTTTAPNPPVEHKIVGQWDFNDPSDLGKATIGDDLELFGNHPVVDGPKDGDGAVLLGLNDYLKVPTNIAASGAGSLVNTYTLSMDIKVDVQDGYNSLLQTNLANTTDGSLFITAAKTMGCGYLGYSNPIFTEAEWQRVILVVEEHKADSVTVNIYINGSHGYEGKSQSVDSRIAFADSILLFRDNDGEEKPTDVAQVVLYNYALDSAEVAELGTPMMKEDIPMIVGQWDFEDADNLGKATVGEDLLLFGNHPVVDGPKDGDGAILLGNDDYLKAVTNLTPIDTNSYANTYTYRIDIKMDVLGWSSLLQTDLTNSIDGRLFVGSSGQVGKSTIGYSENGVIKAGQWHRLIMAVEEDTALNDLSIKVYVDGTQVLEGTHQPVDGWYALRDSVFFFRDDGTEEQPINVAQVVLYNYALDSAEVAELGTPLIKGEIEDPLPEGEKLIANPGFNDGLNGWLFNNADSLANATYELDQSSVINGPNSVKVHIDTCTGGTSSWNIALYTQVPIEEGQKYYITFKIKATEAVSDWDLYWVFYDSIETGNYYNPVGGWGVTTWSMEKDSVYKFELNYTPDFSNPTTDFSIDFAYMNTGPIDFWLDDIQIVKLKKEAPENDLLANNFFNDGLDYWDLNKTVQSNADVSIDPNGVLEGDNSAKVHINGVGTEDWNTQFRQFPIKGLIAGHKYLIQYMAKANKDVSGIAAVIQKNHSPFDNLYAKDISLTADQEIAVEDTFMCNISDSVIVWAFNLGTASVTDVDIWFDDVHIVDLGEATSVEEGSGIPTVYALKQNYPNPFNPTTTINFALPKASDVQLTVYNLLGQKVAELVNNKMVAGYHTVQFNAADLASGVYIYRIKAGSFVSVKKMMLLK